MWKLFSLVCLLATTAKGTSAPSVSPSMNPTASPTMNPTACANNVRNFVMSQLGNSAKLRLAPDCAQTQWVTFEVKDIIETNQIKLSTLTGGTWTVTDQTTYNDTAGNSFPASLYEYVYSGNVRGTPVDVIFQVWLFFQRVDVADTQTCGPGENETCYITVDQNSVKYNLEFPLGWPFGNPANNLTVTVVAHEKSGGTSGSTKSGTTTTFGGYLIMESPTGCRVGPVGSETDVANCASTDGVTTRGTNLETHLIFTPWSPSTDRMDYDPALTVLFGGGSSGAPGRFGYAMMVGVVFSVVAFVFVL